MKNIILASGSPRRHQLLNMIGLQHTVISPTVDEDSIKNSDPIQLAIQLAELKAKEVAHKNQFDLLIAADTIVVLDDKILGKPQTETDAFTMLSLLSGKSHSVITGVTFVNKKMELHSFYVESKVTFSELDNTEISSYIAGGSPMDKAGAYGIQDDLGSLFVKRIDGDYYNVVGLPINQLYNELKHFSPDITEGILRQNSPLNSKV
ncbi:MAG TPA: septum formation protein Maf [Bacteroidetes bacterium]|nr:septum formation protein Maf [Bacteroidota bacterium]